MNENKIPKLMHTRNKYKKKSTSNKIPILKKKRRKKNS